MLPLASTRTRAKSCAIIAALGEICGLAGRCDLESLLLEVAIQRERLREAVPTHDLETGAVDEREAAPAGGQERRQGDLVDCLATHRVLSSGTNDAARSRDAASPRRRCTSAKVSTST